MSETTYNGLSANHIEGRLYMELIQCTWTKIGAVLPSRYFFLGVDDVYLNDLTRFSGTNWELFREDQINNNGKDINSLGDECVSKASSFIIVVADSFNLTEDCYSASALKCSSYLTFVLL